MKVVLEFNDEERTEAKQAINANTMAYALWELQKYRRDLYKGYVRNRIVVNGDRVLDDETIAKQAKQSYAKELCPEEVDETLPNFKDNKVFIPDDDVLNKIDEILYIVRDVLDE